MGRGRFGDILPEPLPPLPPFSENSLNGPSVAAPLQLPASDVSVTSSPEHQSSDLLNIRRMFQTPRNVFGLSRRYHSESPPARDPEENIILEDLSDEPPIADGLSRGPQDSELDFYPYLNKSSFCLAEWYWNHGIQKSRNSFKDLLGIVGSQDFRPEDVQNTNWDGINTQLGNNYFDGSEVDETLWVDEDAGWHRTPIRISVPFHKRNKNPGTQDYIIGDLYHRSLVAVIREKLANKEDDRHFHYDPFELLWSPTDNLHDMRLHGELYTSPAFLDAHREVQELPPEPGCDLPRVVIAMMFSSDATQLTSFSTAKLWPCYLYFGNESKYRRCKPSCHLCNHVAYFQSVIFPFRLLVSCLTVFH